MQSEWPFGKDELGRWLVPVKLVVADYEENARNGGQRPASGYAGVAELAQELRRGGSLVHPVTLGYEDGRYYLAAGFRRYDAAVLVGWETVPAQIAAMGLAERRACNLRENRSRRDTSTYDLALGFDRLAGVLSIGEIAKKTGYTLEYVRQLLTQKRALAPELVALWRAGDARLDTHRRRVLARLATSEQLAVFGLAKSKARGLPRIRKRMRKRLEIESWRKFLNGKLQRQTPSRQMFVLGLEYVLGLVSEDFVVEKLRLQAKPT